jgi:MFS family permease
VTAASKNPIAWPIIIAGCLIAALTFGPRSAMGFFQLPLITEMGFDRATFGLAMAIQNLMWGIGQPIFGALADRFGTWRILALAAILYSSGLFLMSGADTASMLYLSGGVLVGLGIAAGSFGIVLASFARNVAPENRSFVFGVGTAAGSAGMFLFAPYSQALIRRIGDFKRHDADYPADCHSAARELIVRHREPADIPTNRAASTGRSLWASKLCASHCWLFRVWFSGGVYHSTFSGLYC